MNDIQTRPVQDLCISSADNSFVFGAAEPGVWQMAGPSRGQIKCPSNPKLADDLRATMSSADPRVHITLESEGKLYHGTARLRAIEPSIEMEIEDVLVPAE